MTMCPLAWQLVVEGSIPMTFSTPGVVEECGKKQHDELLGAVAGYFERLMALGATRPAVLAVDRHPEYRFGLVVADEWREVVVRPDMEVSLGVGGGIVNLVVEVTTRRWAPSAWLAAYAIGAYLRNLRPTFVLLATPEEVGILPLSSELLKSLDRIRKSPPSSGPEPWMCSNCDLRPVCPDPLA